ncbi:MAG: DNA internalization-related competence protein ComEC/Rec2 [Polyangiaceae bacterium]
MDFVVAFGLALVGGPLLAATPWEACAVALAALVLVPLPRARLRVTFAVLVTVGLAIGLGRGVRAMHVFEDGRARIDRELPGVARCSGRAIVNGSPIFQGGTMRWKARFAGAVCGDARVDHPFEATLYGGPADLARGDEVDVVAQLAPLQRLANRATGDPLPGEARRGVVRSGGAIDTRIVTRSSGVLAGIDRARAATRVRIDATFPPETAGMARALVLGEADLAPEDDEAFRTSGLAHLLAVSGMHLVIAILSLVAVLKAVLVRIEALAARFDVGRIAAAFGIAASWLYADFAGASGSALRAAWMLTAALSATMGGRKSDGVRAFGVSLAAMAFVDPLAVYDVSFLLSAAATAGLLAFSPRFADKPSVPTWARTIARSAAATGAASITCAPILARFAPTLPLGGVLANLVAVPLGECAALPLCLLHAALFPFPAAERGCALAASGGLLLVRGIARAFAGAHWLSVLVPPPTTWQLAAFTVALGACALITGTRRWSIVSICLAFACVAELHAVDVGAPHGVLRATFLDVGQGDAALVDLPDGQAMLIDGGGIVGSPVDVGARVVAPTLRTRRRSDLAVVLLSHPHPDHFGGLFSGTRAIRVGSAWDTGQGEREGVAGNYALFLARMRERGVPIVRPEDLCGVRSLGGAELEVLAPCPGPTADRGPNDNSFVVTIGFGRRRFLFSGDAEHEEEGDLVRSAGGRLRADVLKVAHHGSRTSSTSAFLDAVRPTEAIISVGSRNRFGHPHPNTLASLATAGVRIWRTDQDGEIVAETNGENLDVHRSRDASN